MTSPKKRYECKSCKSIISIKKNQKPTCVCKNPDLVLLSEEFGNLKPTKEVFLRVKEIFKKYLDTTELNYNLITTWTLGTYFHHQFQTYPLLTLTARKRSGKTRTLKLLSFMSQGGDGSTSTSVTETFLFRHKEGSVFFDEMESISSREKTALRETINSVYKRGNKIIRYVERTIDGKRQYVEEEFYPYYPLGLANIYGFDEVLNDRAIQIILQRSNKKQTKLIEDYQTNKEIKNLKENLSNLDVLIPTDFFSGWNEFVQGGKVDAGLRGLFNKICRTELSGRPLELFFPLFIVADKFGVLHILLDCAKQYLSQLEGEYVDNTDDLLNEFIEKSDYNGFVNLSEILHGFRQVIENPEDWINSKWLGRALKRLGFIQKKRLVGGKVQVILNNNTTNSTNTTNTTNSTNLTNTTNSTNNQVEFVELVEFSGLVDKNKESPIDKIKEVKL